MDFFEEMSAAMVRDSARRSIRVDSEVWQKFNSAVSVVPGRKRGTVLADVMTKNVDRDAKNERISADSTAKICRDNAAAETAIKSVLSTDWDGLCKSAMNCCQCPLAATRQNVVFGEGCRNARLMFIGEGPGADEDASGRPFVGAAGQLLDKMIAAMHLERQDVYIANILKCRPPGNRAPGEEEAAACIGFLQKQIELIKPEVIVLLGGTALHFLLKVDGISRWRGRWLEYENIAVMPTFHPAFLLRKPEAKRETWQDLKQVMARLGITV